MKAIGMLIFTGTAGIAVYGYFMLFGIVGLVVSLIALPLAVIAYPFIYLSYSGVFPLLYVALLVIGGLMLYKSD